MKTKSNEQYALGLIWLILFYVIPNPVLQIFALVVACTHVVLSLVASFEEEDKE